MLQIHIRFDLYIKRYPLQAVFLFHQLGAFLGGWLGGVVYDRTGNYDLIWQVSILLSLLAAALNWPVRERPVARLQMQGNAA